MEDDGKASSPSVALASPPSSRPSPSSASSQAPSSSAAAPSINMFYSMERDDFNGGGAANTLGVMEGEDHDLGAEAFADMAMGGIDMSMELNALQIRAFLARNEASNENNGSNTASNVAAASQAQERRNTQEIAQRQTQKPEASAYEALRNGAVHYSRKEDKMKALQEHPAVTSVSTDGRTVGCKCGRNVRLNPPWYILKFDQHVASRNCTFLRQSKASINSGKKKRKLDATKDTTQVLQMTEVGAKATDAIASADDDDDAVSAGQQSRIQRSTENDDGVHVNEDRGVSNQRIDDQHEETRMQQSENAQISYQRRSQVRKPANPGGGEENGDKNDSEADSEEYSLQPIDLILLREFGALEDGRQTIVAPAANSPDSRIRMYKSAITLRGNPHLNRITPDGRFAECKCSRIVLLSAPWQPGQFLMHVADKTKPKKRVKASSEVVEGVQWKKKRAFGSGLSPSAALTTVASTKVRMRPHNPLNALLNAERNKRSFPREIRWDVARARGLLPCPGLRDERMNTFVASAVQLTGGARQRQKIVRELFPHLFPDNSECDLTGADRGVELERNIVDSPKMASKLSQQLLEAEKLLLHDVIEGEALWFVDKDGNSVRSLGCHGVIDAGKGEKRCPSCTSLRSNAALRAAATTKFKIATRPGPPPNPINRKFCSGRVCSMLEAEFDMQELHSRLLRDLALADISSRSSLNMWMRMATMGLSGEFDTHPALLGLTEVMVRLKDKEQRGVGLQNMSYSQHLDTFMRSIFDLSPEACELFQRHLGGRKHRQLLAATSRSALPSKRKLPFTIHSRTDHQQSGDAIYDRGGNTSAPTRVTSEDGFVHLLDPSVVGLSVPNLSIGDIQDVDLSSFSSSGTQHQTQYAIGGAQGLSAAAAVNRTASSESPRASADTQACKEIDNGADVAVNEVPPNNSDSSTCVNSGVQSHGDANPVSSRAKADDNDKEGEESHVESDAGAVAFLTDLTTDEVGCSKTDENAACIPSNHVPCTGLRDENVQAYVANAVQLVGGSRPRYVIARELFPRVFGNDKKVRIVDKLNSEQRVVLQDAVFSECLWRVDKEGRCVRSLRCKRFVPVSDKDDHSLPLNQGVCRACRDLRTVPNFRSVLSRSKVPKKLENIKYVPSVYTESDPFLRKLSKNSAFRGLYQTVKRMTSEQGDNSECGAGRKKQVCFWLRFARMGVFGHFHSHPVFEGLMKSMVEVKDKERRGVGKQNMQYSPELDDFMQAMAQISTEAFELFSGKFCGRTLRSQKVKRRSTVSAPASQDQASVATAGNGSLPTTLPPTATLAANQHYLMQTDDLLGGRSLSSEESQRFMDRMLDEVRLSVSRDILEQERRRGVGDAVEQDQHMNEDDGTRLGPETYLDDEGVLTTEI